MDADAQRDEEPIATRRLVLAADWWEFESGRLADYPARLNARSVRKPITILDWAGRCGMSSDKLIRIMKMKAEPTPVQYWLWRRAINARLTQHSTPQRWLDDELERLQQAAETMFGSVYGLADVMDVSSKDIETWLTVGPQKISTLAKMREALGFKMFTDHIGGGALKRVRHADRLAVVDVSSPPTRAVQVPAILLNARSTIHVVRVWAALVSSAEGVKAFHEHELLLLAFDGRVAAKEQCSRILARMAIAGCAKRIRDGDLEGRWVATWPQAENLWPTNLKGV